MNWHTGRVFISEVFRFEDPGFEMIGGNFDRVCFRGREIG
jgi:hypothetical protein